MTVLSTLAISIVGALPLSEMSSVLSQIQVLILYLMLKRKRQGTGLYDALPSHRK